MSKTIVGKKDLIKYISDDSGVSKADVERVTSAMYDVVMKAVKDGASVRFFNLCTIEAVMSAAKTARNPRTNAPIKVSAKKKLKFKASATSKEDLLKK